MSVSTSAWVQTMANPLLKPVAARLQSSASSFCLHLTLNMFVTIFTHHIWFIWFQHAECTHMSSTYLVILCFNWSTWASFYTNKANSFDAFFHVRHLIPSISCARGVAVSCPGISTETSPLLLPLWTMMWNFFYSGLFSSGSEVPSQRLDIGRSDWQPQWHSCVLISECLL